MFHKKLEKELQEVKELLIRMIADNQKLIDTLKERDTYVQKKIESVSTSDSQEVKELNTRIDKAIERLDNQNEINQNLDKSIEETKSILSKFIERVSEDMQEIFTLLAPARKEAKIKELQKEIDMLKKESKENK